MVCMERCKVHRVKFFDYVPRAIQCLSVDDKKEKQHVRLALARADASIELWKAEEKPTPAAGRSARMSWHQELVIPGSEGGSVETLAWCGERLYSAGLNGQIVDWNLLALVPEVHI